MIQEENKKFLIRLIVIFIVLQMFLQFSSFGQEQGKLKTISKYYYFGPVNEEYTTYINQAGIEVKQGKYTSYYETGQLEREIEYKDGLKNGICRHYSINGSLVNEWSYAGDKMDGEAKIWNRNGTLIAKGIYKDGNPWTGVFSTHSTTSSRNIYDYDETYFMSEYKDGKLVKEDFKKVFDDGKNIEPPNIPINYRKFLRWERYGYDIKTDYPCFNKFPSWKDVPVYLKWILSAKKDAGTSIAYTQLEAISRLDLGRPNEGPPYKINDVSKSFYSGKCSQLWNDWWEKVGKPYAVNLEEKGIIDLEAWKLATNNHTTPVEPYKVLLPDEWVLRTYFRTGDYMGIRGEAIILYRNKESARLIRRFTEKTKGPILWEEWKTLTIKEADRIAIAIAYAVDNPWYFSTLKKIERNAIQAKPRKIEPLTIEGRDYSLYYPHARWSLSDKNGQIWWNDNPFSWRGGDEIYPNFLSDGLIGVGVVFPLVAKAFPEHQRFNGEKSGWQRLDVPNTVAMQSILDELCISDFYINGAPEGSLREAIIVLREHGLPQHLPQIRKFIVDCREYLKVAPVIPVELQNDYLTSTGESYKADTVQKYIEELEGVIIQINSRTSSK